MSKRFDGKAVLVTGVGSGLGQSSALQVAKEGAKLSLVDLNHDSLEEMEKVILEAAPEAEILLITADVSNEEAVQNYVNETVG
ncbi:SDR family NAD(P)-dependent oxidoreductase [Bacillus sp. 37MA]|uniref:SDR family NAD(P)-dependent oxidoreductase n=1 Tax=Bacillus sp. 37MA TaxID=1132442 RepID=UPI000362B574|nr:SDR family NAD(P)-dependent oxidoreductase [Bacillus sp. 37MA]